eukprot:11632751-Alexandrium_andersonii.AAC.1
MPVNSASSELSAMDLRVVDQCFMVRAPRTQDPPHVDRRARKHPTKSVSTNARTPAPSSCQGKL